MSRVLMFVFHFEMIPSRRIQIFENSTVDTA